MPGAMLRPCSKHVAGDRPSVSRVLLTSSTLIAWLVSAGASTLSAAPALTLTPITWNIVGLDSNNVATGPDTFLCGARACNVGDQTAANVVSSFVFDSTNSYINLKPGSPSSLTVSSLAAGACTDCG